MPAVKFVEWDLDPKVRAEVGRGPGIAAINPGLPTSMLVTDRYSMAYSHLKSIRLSDGRAIEGDKVRGDIEDAWDDGETLWVLATFALHRVDRDTMSVSATIRVPHYRHRIVPLLRGRFLALAQSHRQRTPVVSTRDDTVRTVHLPSPELSLDSEAGSVVFSFHDEHAFTYDTDLRKVATRPLPLGVTPVWSGAEIAFLPASWETARNVYPKDPRIRRLYPQGKIGWFDPERWVPRREAPLSDVDGLLGTDALGLLVGIHIEKGLVALIDPASGDIVERHKCSNRINSGVAQAGRSAIAYRHGLDRIAFVQWSHGS